MSYVRIAGGITAYEAREAIRQDTLLVSLSIGARLAPGAELAIGFRVPWSVARPLIEFAAGVAYVTAGAGYGHNGEDARRSHGPSDLTTFART